MSNKQKSVEITLTVNGKELTADAKSHSNLLGYLRNGLRLTGTKLGCATGNCGACNVLIDDTLVQSCQISLAAAQGSDIETIESIVQTPQGSRIANALSRYDAAQCGYCLPGIVVAAHAQMLNADNPNPVEALRQNLCRCGAHSRILKVLQEVIDEQDTST